MTTQDQTGIQQKTVEVFNVNADGFENMTLPPKGMVIQTTYTPDPEASLLKNEVQFSEVIERQGRALNDKAVIIVCAPTAGGLSDTYKYYASTQRRLEEVGLDDRAQIHRNVEAVRKPKAQVQGRAYDVLAA